MKKNYESPIIEVVIIDNDILTASGQVNFGEIPEGDPYAM